MLRGIHHMGRVAAAVILGSSFLLAQEKGLGFDFKLRVANGLSTNDHLNAMAFGFGLNTHYGFDWGTLNGELGYYYKPGRQYLASYDAPATGISPTQTAASVSINGHKADALDHQFSDAERLFDRFVTRVGGRT